MTRITALSALAAALFATFPAAAAPSLFTRVPAPKSTAAPEHLVGTVAVAFDAAALGAMAPGESVSFSLPNGNTYDAVLDRLEKHADGDITWVGRIANGTSDQLVLVTLGAAGTYATFTLPDGNWGAVPGTGVDWIFDADFSHLHVDRSGATDVKVPPELLNAPIAKAAGDPAACETPVTSTPANQVIDVLFAMAPDFVSAHGGAANASTRINNLLSSINTYYANSKVGITLRRVGAVNVAYASASSQTSANCNGATPAAACDGEALDNITASAGTFSHIAQLRNLYQADMVAFMRGGRGGGGASGVAWIGGYQRSNIAVSAGSMYSLSGDSPGISPTLMAHELGHNMGNNHDPANAGTTSFGATSYAYGYTYCGPGGATASCPGNGGSNNTPTGGFGTIMSYWRPTLARFSNPSDTCNGVPCGGTTASTSPAFSAVPDEARTLNCTRTGIGAMKNSAFGLDCPNPTLDSDGDGLPNCQEQALGLSTSTKDNNIFAPDARSTLLFAGQVYRDFLARDGDADGLNFWAGSVMNGTYSRAQAIQGFFNSNEFQGTIAPVARLYFAYFLRIPDYGGLNHWIGQYRAGTSLDSVSQAFAGSAEFVNAYGALNNTQFVTLVYNNVLARAPDAGGLTHWVGQLTSNTMTRGAVMLAFSESAEYKALIASEVYVTMSYAGMLRRAPDAGGFSYWVNYLDGGNSGLALLNGFLTANEYRARFLP